jgi:hypothetical protein
MTHRYAGTASRRFACNAVPNILDRSPVSNRSSGRISRNFRCLRVVQADDFGGCAIVRFPTALKPERSSYRTTI